MQPLCTVAQMRDAEAQLVASGISPSQLIARAGDAVARQIMRRSCGINGHEAAEISVATRT